MKEIVLEGVIGFDVSAEDIRRQLPSGSERVRLLINSPGGSVFESFAIYNALKDYPGKVTARVAGLAASAAADIFFGADEREVYARSAVMYHRARSIAFGTAEDFRAEADILDDIDKIRIKDFARVTGKTPEEAMGEFTAETWLIGSDNILAKGIDAKVVDEEKDGGAAITEPEARIRVAQAMKLLKDVAEKDCPRQAAARQKIAALAQAVVHNSQSNGEAIMDFKEFITQNPGAESEILAFARTKIGPGADEARKAESDRILGILALAGVQVSDDVKQALSGNTTPEKYAVDALTKQREIEAKLRDGNAIAPGKVAQTPGEQSGQAAKPVDAVTEDGAKAIARELSGRR